MAISILVHATHHIIVALLANDLIQFILQVNWATSKDASPLLSHEVRLHVKTLTLPDTLLPQCCVYALLPLTLPDTKVLCMVCKKSQKATLI